MNFLYDEGLQDDSGREHYEIVPHGLAPFGFERTTLVQAMKDKEVHIATDVQPRSALYLSSLGEDCCVIAGWRNNRAGLWWPSVKCKPSKIFEVSGSESAISATIIISC